jgi:rRNA-processing protein FCF1
VRRTSVKGVVVFDGADVVAPPAGRRLVRVRFSPPGVTADDVVRDEVAALDPAIPVAVVTNDRDLRRRVRAEGANVIASDQLLALARR